MKNLVCFDVETTGLSQKEDFIIQLSMVKLDEHLQEIDSRNWYIKPVHNYEMKPTAIEKHGITKEFLESNGVNLKDIANEIIEFFDNCDILTYNGNSFDVGFLYKDLKLVGIDFDFSDRTFYDAFVLYKQLYPSTLEAVYKRYTGKELDNAHNALNDVRATIEVFKHLKQDAQKEGIEDLSTGLISPENSIKSVIIDGKESIVFSFGKYKDDEFLSVYKKDPSYIKWFLSNVASEYTFNILKKYCEKNKTTEKL